MFSQSNFIFSKISRLKAALKSDSVTVVIFLLLLMEPMPLTFSTFTPMRILQISNAKVISRKSKLLTGLMMTWDSFPLDKVVMFSSGNS